MCKTFPTEVSCSMPTVGAGGDNQELNSLCVLSQNILNGKMYLAIWCWMVFLMMLSPICFIYRIMTLSLEKFRTLLLIGKYFAYISSKKIQLILFELNVHIWTETKKGLLFRS